MEELANFIITHLRRGTSPGRLDKARLLERQGEQFEDRDLVERDELIELLESGQRVFVWDDELEDLGAEVDVVRVQGDKFLRTDGQRLRADNLGDIPEI